MNEDKDKAKPIVWSGPSHHTAPDQKTAEEWAEYRGHVNVGHVAGDYAKMIKRKRLGGPRAAFNMADDKAHLYRCAMAKMHWSLGKIVTLEEYDAAVQAAGDVALGVTPKKEG